MFLHVSLDEEELIADTDTIGGLELVGAPEADKGSLVYTFTFPGQDHKIGGDAVDPRTEKVYSASVATRSALFGFGAERRRPTSRCRAR